MKWNQTAGRYILACLFMYLMIQIVYLSCDLLPSAAGEGEARIVRLFLMQSVIFAAGILAVFIILFVQYLKKESTSPFEALVLISDEGKVKKEVLLQDRRSFVITGKKNRRELSVESTGIIAPDKHLYGVCNMISGCWYLEAVSPQRPVGLKRESENVIYRLKEETPYPLCAGDVIYVNACKIVVCKRKHLEESKWV